MLGYNPLEEVKRKSSCLKSDNPRQTNPYIKQVNQRFEETNLVHKTKDMWQEAEKG